MDNEKMIILDVIEYLKGLGCPIVRNEVPWGKNRKKGFSDLLAYTIDQQGDLFAQVIVEIKNKPTQMTEMMQQVSEAAKSLECPFALLVIGNMKYWYDTETFLPINEPRFKSESQYLMNTIEIEQELSKCADILNMQGTGPVEHLQIIASSLIIRFYLDKSYLIRRWLTIVDLEEYLKILRDAQFYFNIEFNDIALRNMSKVLPDLINILDQIPPIGAQLASAFMRFVENIARTNTRFGEYTTTLHVSKFFKEIVDTLDINGGKGIDLTTGYGSILNEVTMVANLESFVAIEKHHEIFNIAKIIAILTGESRIQFICDDALLFDKGKNEHENQYSLVILDPPLGGTIDQKRYEEFQTSQYGGAKLSDLMLEQSLKLAKPGGYIIAMVPEGMLFSSGASKFIRDLIKNKTIIEGIIKLPDHVLKPYTGARVSVLVLRKKSSLDEVANDLFLGRPESLDDMPEVVATFKKWKMKRVQS